MSVRRRVGIVISMKTLGLALGGGGARGLVHVEVLRVLDEFGIRPKALSGASIGAIVGALYCAGHSGMEIRDFVDNHISFSGDRQRWRDDGRKMLEMVKLLDLDFRGTGLIKGDRISHFLYELLEGELLEDLEIPLRIVATDFWESVPVVFSRGPVLAAVKASMSVPGVFSPVSYQDRVLVDGACTNPVPWDLVQDCDVVIGVNALGRSTPVGDEQQPKAPKAARAVLETFDIMQRGILAEKFRLSPPDLLLDPPIRNVALLEFHKAGSVYEQSRDEIARLKDFLETTF